MYIALIDAYVGANYENDGEISKYETRVTTSLHAMWDPFWSDSQGGQRLLENIISVPYKLCHDSWQNKSIPLAAHDKSPNKDLYLKSPPAVSSYIFGSW